MRLLPLFSLALLALSLGTEVQAQAWALEKEKEGIKVYTRRLEGWGIKEFKGVMQLKGCKVEDLERLLRDVSSHALWMADTKDTKVLRKIGDNEILGYSVNVAPWPVSNRDNVTHYTYRREGSALVVDMKGKPKDHPEQSGCVRVSRMQGQWRFEDKGNGSIEVTQQAVADPGGSIPAWLANSAVVDAPFNTLKALRDFVASSKMTAYKR